jgi:hypothetical protein
MCSVKIITVQSMLYLLALKGIKEICPVSYVFCWIGIKFSTGAGKTLLSDSFYLIGPIKVVLYFGTLTLSVQS